MVQRGGGPIDLNVKLHGLGFGARAWGIRGLGGLEAWGRGLSIF